MSETPEIDFSNPDGEAEILARALTLVALLTPESLQRRTVSKTIVVPKAAVIALRDACEAAYPGSINRVRAVLKEAGRG